MKKASLSTVNNFPTVRTQRCTTRPHPTNQTVAKLETVQGAQ